MASRPSEFHDYFPDAPGGYLQTFVSGDLNSPKQAYKDRAATVTHALPVVGDDTSGIQLTAQGYVPDGLFLAEDELYTMVLRTSAGALVRTMDDIGGVGNPSSSLAADFASTASASTGAGKVGMAAYEYARDTVGSAILDDFVNVLWFCTSDAQRNGIKAKTFASDHTAIVAAALTFANGRPVKFPDGGYNVSAATLDKAGQIIFGDGWGRSIIRSYDAAQNLFTVTANDVQIRDIELQGIATNEATATFAIFTSSVTPATGLVVDRVKFSGADGSKGFNNAIKFDDSCHRPTVQGCYFERLYGSTSGHGYGVLTGLINDGRVIGNWFIGAAGRGRHAVYLSAGASGNVAAFNYVEHFVYDALTIYSQGAQPPCSDNLFAYNRLFSCASIAALSNGSIGIAGHALRNSVRNNTITGSLSCGIKVDGTGFVDCADTEISGNDIISSALIGVDLVAAVGGELLDNYIKDSSTGASGTYANVRFISDATTATSGWIVDGNRVPTSATARAAFQTNATAPTPTGLKFSGGSVGSGTATDYEWAGGTFAVDGYVRYSAAHNPGNLASGASDSGATFTVNGAEVGDAVEVWHSNDIGGVWWSGFVTATDTVRTTRYNLSGGANDPANGTIYINVRKRTP